MPTLQELGCNCPQSRDGEPEKSGRPCLLLDFHNPRCDGGPRISPEEAS